MTLADLRSRPSPAVLTKQPRCSLILGLANSRQSALRWPSVPSSSAPIRREYPREDRLALHEVFDFLAQTQRMEVSIGRVVAAGAQPLLRLAVGQFLTPGPEAAGSRRIDHLALVEHIRACLYPMGRRSRLQNGVAILDQGGQVMDRTGGTVIRGLLRFLLIGVCASLIAVSSVQAAEPMTTAPAKLADGIWRVQGRAIPGTRCGDWLVRLTNTRGQLSGVLSLARSSVPIRNLALLPDGSFSGITRAGLVGSRHARAYKVTGQFSGDTVNLTLEDNVCPPRHGMATREAGGR